MALSLMETSLTYQDYCFNTEEATVCTHYLLEEYGIPEEEEPCSRCETNWAQRLADVVERTDRKYTTAYPCMTEEGHGHIIPHLYAVCPHCKWPRKDHISRLVRELAKSLVGTNVPEVKFNLKERVPVDFDARLFVAGAATAYPELYQSCLAEWMVKSQDKDLIGEVILYITPVKSMH